MVFFDKDIHMEGMRVVIDCANGATTTIAPEVFKKTRSRC